MRPSVEKFLPVLRRRQVGQIHFICSDAGIPCGHVVDRVKELAGKVNHGEA